MAEVSRQIQTNLVRMRPDRIQCEYNEFNDDCRENRILRSALEISAKYLSHFSPEPDSIPEGITRKIAASRAALANVKYPKIRRQDFAHINYNGAFRAYKPSHILAKAIIFHLGINPENLVDIQKTKQIPPFVICSFELFERYAEVILRQNFGNAKIWVGYQDNNLTPESGKYDVRPDMIVVDKDGTSLVIDCKYKNVSNKDIGKLDRADVYKSVAYAHHKGVIAKINELRGNNSQNNQENQNTILLYPEISTDSQDLDISKRIKIPDDNNTKNMDNSFQFPIKIYRVICPAKPVK